VIVGPGEAYLEHLPRSRLKWLDKLPDKKTIQKFDPEIFIAYTAQ